MYKFFVYDAKRERVATLQSWESIQWLEHYQKPGEVKLVVMPTAENRAFLVEGNRIFSPDNPVQSTAKIVQVQPAGQGGNLRITIDCDITSRLLQERVVMGTQTVSNAEAAMYSIYTQNRRALPIEVAAKQGYTETANTEIAWGSVLQAQQTIAAKAGLGFKVVFNPLTKTETFTVYKGTNRTARGDAYVGMFSTELGNIKDILLKQGEIDYKNVAVVQGAGEGTAQAVRIVSTGNFTAEARRELYVDAKSVQRTYSVATDTGELDENGSPVYSYTQATYTTAAYNALLDAKGLEKLQEHLKTLSLAIEVEQNNLVYGSDYFLGDRLPLRLPDYGLFVSGRLASVLTVYERSGKRIVPTFDDFIFM